MRILLYGGSFDPPHYGHLNNLRAAAARVCPDRVVVMPAGVSPFKQGTSAPGPLRVEMCGCFAELAREMGFGLEVSGWEVEQAEQGRKNYSVLTLEKLARENPGDELYLAIGPAAGRFRRAHPVRAGGGSAHGVQRPPHPPRRRRGM